MTENNLDLLDFGNEAGEDASSKETESYFVEQRDFSQFLNLDKRFLIVRAKKGVGKSALLEWLSIKHSKDSEVFVVKIRGSDLSKFSVPNLLDSDQPNDRIYNWMSRIATVINREIGKRINFAFDDDDVPLVQSSEIDGFREKNLITSLLDRLGPSIEQFGIKSEKLKSQMI